MANHRRIHINVQDGISDEDAVRYVGVVVSLGRRSDNETEYCYCTTFKDKAGIRTVVYAQRTRAGNNTFTVALDRFVSGAPDKKD